jgi:hypothetical protein
MALPEIENKLRPEAENGRYPRERRIIASVSQSMRKSAVCRLPSGPPWRVLSLSVRLRGLANDDERRPEAWVQVLV